MCYILKSYTLVYTNFSCVTIGGCTNMRLRSFVHSFTLLVFPLSTERMGIFPHCFKLSWLTDRDRKQSVFLSFSWRTQMFKMNSGKGNKHFHMKSTHWGLHPSHQLIYTTVNQSAGHIKTYNMYIWNGMVFDIQCEMQQDWNLTMQTRESKSTASTAWCDPDTKYLHGNPDHWLNGISQFPFYWFRVD